ncbi:Hypothetical predicted protein [Octopus vulgaris]|uniref:Uncharacterized protein n=1 Tax=Octopus vulgaris TaxID=6645 RepID=A0AA36FJP2_OCTVU|nr:Hypothetical predicted protein [Octopus vulgaris]
MFISQRTNANTASMNQQIEMENICMNLKLVFSVLSQNIKKRRSQCHQKFQEEYSHCRICQSLQCYATESYLSGDQNIHEDKPEWLLKKWINIRPDAYIVRET